MSVISQNRITGTNALLTGEGSPSAPQKISEEEMQSRVAALSVMSIPELHDEWARVWGTRPYTRNYALLRRRIKWRLYTLCYGGLAVSELRKAEELADLTQLRERAPSRKRAKSPLRTQKEVVSVPAPEPDANDPLAPLLAAGSYARKTFNRKEHVVYSLGRNRYSYNGAVFASLSAVACHIAGYKLSGRKFFSTNTIISSQS